MSLDARSDFRIQGQVRIILVLCSLVYTFRSASIRIIACSTRHTKSYQHVGDTAWDRRRRSHTRRELVEGLPPQLHPMRNVLISPHARFSTRVCVQEGQTPSLAWAWGGGQPHRRRLRSHEVKRQSVPSGGCFGLRCSTAGRLGQADACDAWLWRVAFSHSGGGTMLTISCL